jgi:hypothetical protein
MIAEPVTSGSAISFWAIDRPVARGAAMKGRRGLCCVPPQAFMFSYI